MLLAIDAGNTNIVFAILEGETIRAQWRAATRADRTADEYIVWLRELMGLQGLKSEDVRGAIISTVVPQALFSLQTLCRKHFGTEPLVIGARDVDLGLAIHVKEPRQVGADRIVNAVAAHSRHPGDLIIIDFGTATTFDVVAADGAYEGGIIAPGINLSAEALHMATAQLPRIAIERPQAIIGWDTISAMQSGVFWGYIGLIEGLVARIKEEYAKPLKVIATGGLAPLFTASTPVIEAVDADLTIRGLGEVYARNKSGARSNA